MSKSLLEQVHALPGGQEFIDEVDTQKADSLKARVVSLQQGLKEVEESDAHQTNLEEAKELRAKANEIMSSYKDLKKAVGLKTKYVLQRLSEKV